MSSTADPLAPGLEIETDVALQQKFWVFERVGWVAMAAVMAAAAAGLMGPGPISETAATAGGIRLEYLRYGRLLSAQPLGVCFLPSSGSDKKRQVWLSSSLLESHDVEQITPEPERAILVAGGVVYEFAADRQAGPAQVRFQLKPNRAGWVRGAAGSSPATAIRFTQFIYP